MKFINKYEYLDEETKNIIREMKKIKGQMIDGKDLFTASYYRKKFAEENIEEFKTDTNKRKDAKKTHPERLIEYALTANNYRFNSEYKLIGHYYDFYLTDLNILIEVDGEFWHPESFNDAKYKSQKKNFFNDIIKEALADSSRIPLIRLRENKINSLSAPELQEEVKRLVEEKLKEYKDE